MKTPLFLSLLLILAGCATPPKDFETTDLGPIPTSAQFEPAIRAYLDESLVDPYSAHIKFLDTTPRRAWYRDPLADGGKTYSGYLVSVSVNAKNRMGGYTGQQLHGFLFRDGRIIKAIDPEGMARMKIPANY